jgi:hypothetical protein
MKKIFLLAIFVVLLMVSSSYKSEQTADPEIFATKVWSFLQKKDSVGFVNFLTYNKDDLQSMKDIVKNDKMITENSKQFYLYVFNDTNFVIEANVQIGRVYNSVQKYFTDHNLDISKFNFVSLDYKIKKSKAIPFVGIKLNLFVQNDTIVYKIAFVESLQINGVYKNLRGGFVYKLNQDYKIIYDDYYAQDTIAVAIEADSSSVVQEINIEENTVYDQSQMSAKQKKYYKKIEKLNKQTELLYQKIAEEDMVFEK